MVDEWKRSGINGVDLIYIVVIWKLDVSDKDKGSGGFRACALAFQVLMSISRAVGRSRFIRCTICMEAWFTNVSIGHSRVMN